MIHERGNVWRRERKDMDKEKEDEMSNELQ